MDFEATRTIAAGLTQTWEVLTDVVRWPEWTDSMTSVTLLDSGPLQVGSRARIKQPGMPAMTRGRSLKIDPIMPS